MALCGTQTTMLCCFINIYGYYHKQMLYISMNYCENLQQAPQDWICQQSIPDRKGFIAPCHSLMNQLLLVDSGQVTYQLVNLPGTNGQLQTDGHPDDADETQKNHTRKQSRMNSVKGFGKGIKGADGRLQDGGNNSNQNMLRTLQNCPKPNLIKSFQKVIPRIRIQLKERVHVWSTQDSGLCTIPKNKIK